MDCLLWLIVLGQKINKSCVTKDDTLGTTPKLYIPITINIDCKYVYALVDVLWGQPIKLIQVVSTSEFQEY